MPCPPMQPTRLLLPLRQLAQSAFRRNKIRAAQQHLAAIVRRGLQRDAASGHVGECCWGLQVLVKRWGTASAPQRLHQFEVITPGKAAGKLHPWLLPAVGVRLADGEHRAGVDGPAARRAGDGAGADNRIRHPWRGCGVTRLRA